MIVSKEDLEFIDFAYGCINKAHYPSSKQTVDVYNKVFSDRPNFKPRAMTSCGSCIRQMVLEMKQEKDKLIEKFEEENNLKENNLKENNLKKEEENKDGNKLSEGSTSGRDNLRPDERNEQVSSSEKATGKTV